MYAQRTPSYALAPEKREKNAFRSKLFAKSTGPFRVTDVRGDEATIDQNGMRHTVSIDRVKSVHAMWTRRQSRRKRGCQRKKQVTVGQTHVVQRLVLRRGQVTHREYLVQ